MKRVLLVDDDPLILRAYQESLSHHGFQVDTANDGLSAMKALSTAPPDVVVLDLMMPMFSGVDVLKFIRAQADLGRLPVIVLSNCYMDDVSRQAEAAGVHSTLLKAHTTPTVLTDAIQAALCRTDLPAAQTQPDATISQNTLESATPPEELSAPADQSTSPDGSTREDPPVRTHACRDFLAAGASQCAALRKLFQAFSGASSNSDRDRRLQDLYRKVHFLTATAGLVECQAVALLASVFEGMLYSLMDRPSLIAPSTTQTMRQTIDFFEALFERPPEVPAAAPQAFEVLAVDDDPLANRVAAGAFQLAQVKVQTTEDSLVAWQWVNRKQFHLVLLDIEMPGLGGYDFCRRLRGLPDYRDIPVIFVTVHTDFESRAQSVLNGGDDLIAKPVLPIELAVKTVTHLLRSRLQD
jgi:CheY-like chemotaxis protein